MVQTTLYIGTKKGAFIARSDDGRREWTLRGPFCEYWPINHMTLDERRGAILAAGGNAWFGHAIWRSGDDGETWSQSSAGLDYAAGEEPISEVWAIASACDGTLYAGVGPAGLFRSADGGETWAEVMGFREAPHREYWSPGGAGLILHNILTHPTDPLRMYVAISSAGVYATEDGGETWEARNRGLQASWLPEHQREDPLAGQCTHRLTVSADNWEVLVQRNHEMVWRSKNGGRSWENIDAGLPTEFGFAAAAHPRDPRTFYVIPLTDPMSGRFAPDGKLAVYRTKDLGDTWQRMENGLPQKDAYYAVLRGAMATDTASPAGVYFGSVSGDVFASVDDGESWTRLPFTLPAISSVEAFTR